MEDNTKWRFTDLEQRKCGKAGHMAKKCHSREMTHQPEDTLNLNGIYPVTKQNTTGYNVDVDIDGPRIIMQLYL